MGQAKRIDLRLPLWLLGACIAANGFAQTVERGPYLQSATPTSIIVRWRTDQAVNGVVRYGTTLGSLTSSAVGTTGTEHDVELTGLQPETRYYYSIGTSVGPLAGDSSYTFVTPPPSGAVRATRIWVLGDSGHPTNNARAVRDAYYDFTGTRATDLWLMLGDNAYSNGTDAEYQAAVFEMYPTMLRQSPLWPTLGNHDGLSASSAAQTGPYYDIFTLPKNGEAGGLASGTEAYYSFDRANIHFVVLDSYDSNRSSTGPMLTWLESDLATNQQDWLIAFWHHPPYSKGSHNSDGEVRLVDMRQNAVPLLESYGVDLVLTGHSHSYERSFLIDGHYGTSATFTNSMKVDGGSGRVDGTGAYEKTAPGAINEGAVYAVAGSSSAIEGGTLNHPAMFVSLNVLGSMVLDVNGMRLDAYFLDDTGDVRDYFTMLKGGSAPPDTEAPSVPSNLRAVTVTETSVSLAWSASTDNVAVTGYRVARDGQTIATINSRTLSNSGLTAGTSYTYTVRALDAAGNESAPATLTVTTSLPAADTQAPTSPSNLRTTSVTASGVALRWDAASDNVAVTGYRVSRGGQVLATVGTLTFNDSGLQAGTTYQYGVVAVDAAGNASAPVTLSVTTSAPPPPPADTQAPTSPSNLRTTSVTASGVALRWDAASDNVGVTGYRVSRGGQVRATVASLTFNESGLQPSTTYQYGVVAVDAAGNASAPVTLSVTTSAPPAPPADTQAPTSPANLRTSAVTENSVALRWDAASDNVGVTGYRVSRGGQVLATVGSLTFDDAGLQAATTYQYGVVAVDAAGNASASAALSVTTSTPAQTSGNADDDGGGGSADPLLLATLLGVAGLALGRRHARAPRAVALQRIALTMLAVAWVQPAFPHGDVDLELIHVTELIETRPMDAELYLQRGELRRLDHDWAGALDDFASAAELGSAAIRDELALYRGRLHQEAQESHRAVAELDAYIERHPRHADALRARALAYEQMGAIDAAVADYTRILTLASARGSPELWLERARVLTGAGRIDAALAGIDEAIATLGPLVTLVEFEIDAEIAREDYGAALERMAALPAALADTPIWLGRRGDVLGKLGRTDDASRAYARAREAILRMPASRRQTLAMQDLLARLDPADGPTSVSR